MATSQESVTPEHIEQRLIEWIREELIPLLSGGKRAANFKVVLNINGGDGGVSAVVEKHIKE